MVRLRKSLCIIFGSKTIICSFGLLNCSIVCITNGLFDKKMSQVGYCDCVVYFTLLISCQAFHSRKWSFFNFSEQTFTEFVWMTLGCLTSKDEEFAKGCRGCKGCMGSGGWGSGRWATSCEVRHVDTD